MLIILIHNDGTGTEENANYTYEVRINDKVLEYGSIKGHNRSDGWRTLLGVIGECEVCQLSVSKKKKLKPRRKIYKTSFGSL